MATPVAATDRRQEITEAVSLKGFMSLADLVEALGVSESTIRRDLEALEHKGVLRRTRGGAFSLKDSPQHAIAFADRQMTAAAEKRAIAAVVAGRIPEGQTLILNGGTTCFEVARALAGRRLSVITNSLPIASLLSGELATEVTLIGGYVYPRTGVALGPEAERMLRGLRAAQLVLSCAGLTEAGGFNANQMMVDVERTMMAVAAEVILAADHTKFGRVGVVQLFGWDEIDVVATDAGLDAGARAWLGARDVELVCADVPQPGGAAQ